MRTTLAIVGAAWAAAATVAAASAAGLHFNRTASMPAGIWLQQPIHGDLTDGQAVVVCLPNSPEVRRYIGPGACPNGLEPLLKTVGAVAGDQVEITAAGVRVNGHPLLNTAPLTHDGAGHSITPYPAGTYRVGPGQIFLFSSHSPQSFDSRYFGPVVIDNVKATATPVLTGK